MSDQAPSASDHSIGAMISEVASDVTRLLRQEVELAKTEIRTEAGKAAKAGRLIATGALALHLTAVLASAAIAFAASALVADRWPDLAWIAPAITVGGVAAFWLLVGLVQLSRGRRRLRRLSPVPRQTIQTLKEDIAWLRKPTA